MSGRAGKRRTSVFHSPGWLHLKSPGRFLRGGTVEEREGRKKKAGWRNNAMV
jgi:hypothetical protein